MPRAIGPEEEERSRVAHVFLCASLFDRTNRRCVEAPSPETTGAVLDVAPERALRALVDESLHGGLRLPVNAEGTRKRHSDSGLEATASTPLQSALPTGKTSATGSIAKPREIEAPKSRRRHSFYGGTKHRARDDTASQRQRDDRAEHGKCEVVVDPPAEACSSHKIAVTDECLARERTAAEEGGGPLLSEQSTSQSKQPVEVRDCSCIHRLYLVNGFEEGNRESPVDARRLADEWLQPDMIKTRTRRGSLVTLSVPRASLSRRGSSVKSSTQDSGTQREPSFKSFIQGLRTLSTERHEDQKKRLRSSKSWISDSQYVQWKAARYRLPRQRAAFGFPATLLTVPVAATFSLRIFISSWAAEGAVRAPSDEPDTVSASYTSHFTHLVTGPAGRSSDSAEQLRRTIARLRVTDEHHYSDDLCAVSATRQNHRQGNLTPNDVTAQNFDHNNQVDFTHQNMLRVLEPSRNVLKINNHDGAMQCCLPQTLRADHRSRAEASSGQASLVQPTPPTGDIIGKSSLFPTWI
ncbi:hypothetical protein HPB51_013242 [Rhipicephalus microplus]|uniref:Uncharacterized protein n=1 Tax=Rhipicephalus microplus TaxID=6941 RepID=A0A9J6F4D9_RHIMP|nr:hypothetical protein HPB51_013242 [Rhipicephalus microplus]